MNVLLNLSGLRYSVEALRHLLVICCSLHCIECLMAILLNLAVWFCLHENTFLSKAIFSGACCDFSSGWPHRTGILLILQVYLQVLGALISLDLGLHSLLVCSSERVLHCWYDGLDVGGAPGNQHRCQLLIIDLPFEFLTFHKKL